MGHIFHDQPDNFADGKTRLQGDRFCIVIFRLFPADPVPFGTFDPDRSEPGLSCPDRRREDIAAAAVGADAVSRGLPERCLGETHFVPAFRNDGH